MAQRFDPAAAADLRESRFRLGMAWMLLLFWVVLYLGGAWDVQWHSDVGPDRFWTPPHTAMYTGVALSGLISLLVVVQTTLLYRRRTPGVSDATTTRWLGGLRAPLGFIVNGMGVVVFGFFGGFDEFWHSAYGFDVTLWSPPHIGLYIGGLIGLMGTVYAFASELARARHRGDPGLLSAPALGLMASAAVMMDFAALPITPALTEAAFLGPFSLYPLMATAVFTLGLVIPAAVLRIPRAATFTGVGVLLLRLATEVVTPPLVRWLAASEGLPTKPDALGFTIQILAVPTLIFVAGAIIDVAIASGGVFKANPKLAVSVGSAAAMLALWSAEKPWIKSLSRLTFLVRFPDVQAGMAAGHAARLAPTMLGVTLLALLVGYLAWEFGIMLRYTDR